MRYFNNCGIVWQPSGNGGRLLGRFQDIYSFNIRTPENNELIDFLLWGNRSFSRSILGTKGSYLG